MIPHKISGTAFREMAQRTLGAVSVALGLLLCLLPASTQSQTLAWQSESYSISFAAGWTAQDSALNILVKNMGINGAAWLTHGPDEGIDLPVDSLQNQYADLMGGDLKRTQDKQITLGTHSVRLVEYSYDSLPALAAFTGVTLKNGTFRIYYLREKGWHFSLLGLPIPLPPPFGAAFMKAFYDDVETSISAMSFKERPQTSVRANDLLSGWKVTERKLTAPLGVDASSWNVICFDATGSRLGDARVTQENGASVWLLPEASPAGYLLLRSSEGGQRVKRYR